MPYRSVHNDSLVVAEIRRRSIKFDFNENSSSLLLLFVIVNFSVGELNLHLAHVLALYVMPEICKSTRWRPQAASATV